MTLQPNFNVARGRVWAEQLMVDRCVIERRSGRVFNDDTGQYDDTWEPVYEGKCRMQVSKWKPVEETPGGAITYHIAEATVQLPVDGTLYERGDRVRVTHATMDTALLEQVMVVKNTVTKTHDVIRRLGVSEVTV